ARVRQRHRAIGDLPAVDPLLQRLPHGLLDRLEEGERHRAELDLQAKSDAGADRSRLDAQPDARQERRRALAEQLDRLTDADGPRRADPLSKTLIAVTFAFASCSSPSRWNRRRSRTRIVPEKTRAYAIFSPDALRSSLKTLPDTGPSASPSAAGSSPVMAELS